MTRLNWGLPGSRRFETGVDRGVLYVHGQPGVAWPGLTGVVEQPRGAEPRPYYIDGIKYLNHSTLEEYEGGISAFYSPSEFDACDGTLYVSEGVSTTQQVRSSFGFSFRTKLGNDLKGVDYGHKIHLIYDALAQPTQRRYQTISDDPEAAPLSWSFTTKAVLFPKVLPTAHIYFDSTKMHPEAFAEIEAILYGTDISDPRMPTPQEIMDIALSDRTLTVVDNGNGTFSVTGSDDSLVVLEGSYFELTSPAVEDLGDGTFTITYT